MYYTIEQNITFSSVQSKMNKKCVRISSKTQIPTYYISPPYDKKIVKFLTITTLKYVCIKHGARFFQFEIIINGLVISFRFI